MKKINYLVGILLIVLTSINSLAHELTIHLNSSAEHPFECYSTRIYSSCTSTEIEGKILRVYFGYTHESEMVFKRNRNLPWYNANGEPVAEGYVDVIYVHDGGYKGVINALPVTIQAPSGLNVLYRLSYLKRAPGECGSSIFPLKTTYAESDVFFIKNAL
jgi:hypothetical protein